MESMERTVVRCAEGHVFATSSFPMQQLGAGRIGPGRLLRCPRCARLRQAVPVGPRSGRPECAGRTSDGGRR
ncbi:hypothetical protein [Streptomyces sp. 196(2019)]|uniref:hypothetical protein n=1 Tax=Streptomyces sp. 196(2019) TaxID=2683820 RepID=UPI0013EA41F4|nr:hypothetical protein [Streptomyces sp. 196(2019)]NGO82480.1 hypothetical protein [Streptomyces sp. 196(2019)]